MKKRFSVTKIIFSIAALALFAIAVQTVEFPQGVNMRDLLGATDVLTVNVNNPDVPEPPPPDTGGGGSSGGGGGGGGGNNRGGAVIATTATTTTNTKITSSKKRGDISGDSKVNLVDFSILAFWYKRSLTQDALDRGIDLNSDGKVTLADFSILAYYWDR